MVVLVSLNNLNEKARDIASLLNEENDILAYLVLQSIKRDAKTIKGLRKK